MNTTSISRRILIIDDDELNSKALGLRLERRGFEVTVISDPFLIFETVENKKIELILLDIVMPKADGIIMLKEIRAKYEKHLLPIIMSTAIDDSIDIIDAFKLGANDYIAKPINVDVAVARINAHLSIMDLHKEGIKKSELEAVNALITTYNHEINNSLAIAIGYLGSDLVHDENTVIKLKSALWRIAEIVKKIKEISDNKELEFQNYVGNEKMVKIK